MARNVQYRLTTLPDTIGNLTNLFNLRLDGNQLTTLPSSMAQLSTLTSVDISDQRPIVVENCLYLAGNRWSAEFRQAADQGIEALWEHLKNHNAVDDKEQVSDETVESVVDDELTFQVNPDPAAMLDIRGLLEQLIGLTTDLVQQGKFEDDPLLEQRVDRDRESLRYELFENPDGFDSPIIAGVTQRVLASIIPVLDDGPNKDLLRAIAGTSQPNLQSQEAGEEAMNKGQAVADELSPDAEQIPAGVSTSRWVAGALRWGPPVVEGVGLGATITGTLLALGATGPVGIAIGAALGILALFRPRNR